MALAINIWCKGNTAYIGYGNLYIRDYSNASYEAKQSYIRSRDSAKDYCKMMIDSLHYNGDGMYVWSRGKDVLRTGILARRNINKIHVYLYPVGFSIRDKHGINHDSNIIDMMTWYNRDYIVGQLDNVFSLYLQREDRTHMTMVYHFHDILYGFEDSSSYKLIVSKIKIFHIGGEKKCQD